MNTNQYKPGCNCSSGAKITDGHIETVHFYCDEHAEENALFEARIKSALILAAILIGTVVFMIFT